LLEPEMIVRARDFLEEHLHVDDLEIEDAEGPRADDAEIGVAQHDRVGCAPFVAGEKAGIDVIEVRLERRMQAVLPAFEGGKDGDVVGGEREFAGAESVAELAEVHELRGLRFADDQLRAVFDFPILIRVTEGNGIAGIILPLDDFEELCLEIINETHKFGG